MNITRILEVLNQHIVNIEKENQLKEWQIERLEREQNERKS